MILREGGKEKGGGGWRRRNKEIAGGLESWRGVGAVLCRPLSGHPDDNVI